MERLARTKSFGISRPQQQLALLPWHGVFTCTGKSRLRRPRHFSLSTIRAPEGIHTLCQIIPLADTNSTDSLLFSYLFLVDVIRAIHCGQVTCISTKELFMRMPSSPYNFHHIYNHLISGLQPLPSDLKADEDGLLLLTGICADILYLQHSFSNMTLGAKKLARQSLPNPYAPFSPTSKIHHHQYILSAALSRWYQHFAKTVAQDVLTLFFFCKLLLVFPEVLCLPRRAGYPPNATGSSMLPQPSENVPLNVSDEAMRSAWLILDSLTDRRDAPGFNVSIWLPVVVFGAALTIWCQLQPQNSASNSRPGTLRALSMFKDELVQLPWPCCADMCSILDKLRINT